MGPTREPKVAYLRTRRFFVAHAAARWPGGTGHGIAGWVFLNGAEQHQHLYVGIYGPHLAQSVRVPLVEAGPPTVLVADLAGAVATLLSGQPIVHAFYFDPHVWTKRVSATALDLLRIYPVEHPADRNS